MISPIITSKLKSPGLFGRESHGYSVTPAAKSDDCGIKSMCETREAGFRLDSGKPQTFKEEV